MNCASNQDCCNQNCDQGRSCPSKKSVDLWLFAPIAAAILMFGVLFLSVFTQEKRSVVYNCSLSEISPDFPLAVKEECRKRKKI